MRMTDETKEHINICRMQDCRLRAVCKTPILHTARSTQADGDDIKMHADWCKKFVKGINWQGGSGRCPLCRRIHADLTPLQNLHAHAHCRLDTIADLTLGAMSMGVPPPSKTEQAGVRRRKDLGELTKTQDLWVTLTMQNCTWTVQFCPKEISEHHSKWH